MASKAVSSKSSKRGLKSGTPSRSRRNTTVVNNERESVIASARRTAGGLGAGVEPKNGATKRAAGRGAPAADDGSEVGRRVGRSKDNVKRAQARPEKTARNRPVDTAKKGVAADDKKVGNGHTARRNTKLNTEGMAYMLEDSATGKPSRKSTRRGSNRLKQSTQLTRKTKRNLHTPEADALRAQASRR